MTIVEYGRGDSGIAKERNVVIPYEDLNEGNEIKSIIVELSSRIQRYDITGLYISCRFYFLIDSNGDIPQYGVRQNFESWFEILE